MHGFGSKMTITPEHRERQRLRRLDPNYMIPMLQSQLTVQLASLAKEQATDPAVNPSRGNNIAVWMRASAKTRGQIAEWERKRDAGMVRQTHPLRPGIPVAQLARDRALQATGGVGGLLTSPVVIAAAVIAGALLLRR